MGFLLQDMDSMVMTTMVIEREIENARSIRDTGAGGKRKESQSSSSSGNKSKASSSRGLGFRAVAIKAKVRPGLLVMRDRQFFVSAINLYI